MLRETRRAVGYPRRWLLNGSPFSVARTIVFYWHSTWRGDNRCCSLSTVYVSHFINFVLLYLNVFCEDVGAADFVYSEWNFAGSEQWEPAYIPTWCYMCEYLDLELMFVLRRVLNLEIRSGLGSRYHCRLVFWKCLIRISAGTQPFLRPTFVWFYLHPYSRCRERTPTELEWGWGEMMPDVPLNWNTEQETERTCV